MSKKTITISEELYNQLLELKKEAKEEYQRYIDGGWTKKDREEEGIFSPTFDSVISNLINELKNEKEMNESHHAPFCKCDTCEQVRQDFLELQAEEAAEERWSELHEEW